MSLLVWLPMTKDLSDQGLGGCTITNDGATLDNNGKLGKCYNFDGTNDRILVSGLNQPKDISVAFWIKRNANTGTRQFLFTAWSGVSIELGTTGTIFGKVYSNSGETGYATGTTITTDSGWVHVVYTFQDKVGGKIYINGELKQSSASSYSIAWNVTSGYIGNYSNIYLNAKLNDFRIYDHALAPKEIEILSRGLVCHYPLSDRSNQTSNNVFTNPTFASSSGWGFWGQSGHSGTWNFTQNKDYIFNKTQTNACVISNGASATGDYLMYQSPAFSGGFRSLQAIIKEENSKTITDSIAYPVWNASASGSTPLNHWTSINDLGNGFYLCRCESIKQDGSNNLVGIYVKPGYKIYVSECYCENDRTVCSDFFYPSTTVYDTSGYQYNGTISGSLTISNDTARYSVSTYIPKAGYIQHPNALGADNANQEWTCCAWVKLTGTDSNQYLNNFNLNNILRASSTPLLYLNSGSHDYYMYGSVASPINSWTHIAFVFKNSTGLKNVYINGELKNGYGPNKDSTPAGIPNTITIFGGNFDGYVSDYREYATALSATQVAELYNTAVSVANNGTLLGYELVEV